MAAIRLSNQKHTTNEQTNEHRQTNTHTQTHTQNNHFLTDQIRNIHHKHAKMYTFFRYTTGLVEKRHVKL